MSAVLIIKLSSTVMQDKRKLCECHTRFFTLFYDLKINLSYISIHKFVFMRQEYNFLFKFMQ